MPFDIDGFRMSSNGLREIGSSRRSYSTFARVNLEKVSFIRVRHVLTDDLKRKNSVRLWRDRFE